MAFLHRRQLAAQHVADFASRKDYASTFPTPLPDDAYCDNWLAANGLALLRRAPQAKPWHLAVNFCGPHEPMDITASMEKSARGRNFPQPHQNSEFPPETHTAIRQNYAAMIENIDRWVGLYIEELRRRNELDNTLIVFSSDHGEMLGDHNRWAKSVPYHASAAVPLIIAGPGVRKGKVSAALVSLIDLAATFLDYASVPVPKTEMDSLSLRPVLEGKSPTHRQVVRSGLNRWRLVFDGRYKLVTGFDLSQPRNQQNAAKDTPPLLFDLQSDPTESTNIASSHPQVLTRLQKYINA
jgi:arylsulfatase